MKSLCILLALLGQFQEPYRLNEYKVEELPAVLPIQPGTFIQEELPSPKAVEVKPHFELLGASWCGGCILTRTAVDAIPAKDRPFTYSYRDVDSKGWLGASSIPAWAYDGKVIQYGFSTPENLMKNFRNATQPKQARATQRLSPAQLKEFARTYNGPLRGVKGNNFWAHLQDVPNHGFLAWQLNGLSQRECEMIHGGQHYGYLTPFKIGN